MWIKKERNFSSHALYIFPHYRRGKKAINIMQASFQKTDWGLCFEEGVQGDKQGREERMEALCHITQRQGLWTAILLIRSSSTSHKLPLHTTAGGMVWQKALIMINQSLWELQDTASSKERDKRLPSRQQEQRAKERISWGRF